MTSRKFDRQPTQVQTLERDGRPEAEVDVQCLPGDIAGPGRRERKAMEQGRQMPNLVIAGGWLVFPNGTTRGDIGIAGGRIVDRSEAESETHIRVDAADCFVFPGFINSHDHLSMALFPRSRGGDWPNVHDWREDVYRSEDPPFSTIRRITEEDCVLWGAYRNLLGGVTAVADVRPRPSEAENSGLPVKVLSGFVSGHSVEDPATVLKAFRSTNGIRPFLIHLAEGWDREAQNEPARARELGILGPNTLIVGGVGIDERDIPALRKEGVGLVWCPSANRHILNATVRPHLLGGALRGVLGTESALCGRGNLLDEVRAAAEEALVPLSRILRMITTEAAHVFRLPDRSGTLLPEAPGDVVILPRLAHHPVRSLLGCRSEDIRLVLVDGGPQLADPDLAGLFQAGGRSSCRFRINGREKLIARPFEDLYKRTISALPPEAALTPIGCRIEP